MLVLEEAASKRIFPSVDLRRSLCCSKLVLSEVTHDRTTKTC